MEKIEGISVALLTPFKKTGEIDYEALKEHCNFLYVRNYRRKFFNETS
jgi:dihydrodipicolinate synthase/N-acetylneuraminate lyase